MVVPDLVLEFYERGGQNRVSFDYRLISILPVELSYFEATKHATEGVMLNWITESELNNNYFDIERSVDGISWETIGQVEGNETSQVSMAYSYHDQTALSGYYYYRLKQVDFDGSANYSETKAVHITTASTTTAYPNPTQGNLTVDGIFDTNATIQVFNALGQRVQHGVEVLGRSENRIKLDLQRLQAGVYTIKIGGKSLRVVKQ